MRQRRAAGAKRPPESQADGQIPGLQRRRNPPARPKHEQDSKRPGRDECQGVQERGVVCGGAVLEVINHRKYAANK